MLTKNVSLRYNHIDIPEVPKLVRDPENRAGRGTRVPVYPRVHVKIKGLFENANLQEDPSPFPQKLKPRKGKLMGEINKYRVILPGK